MTQQADNFAKALYQLEMTPEILNGISGMLETVPQLKAVLEHPTITKEQKHRIIAKLMRAGQYPKVAENFLKYLCDRGEVFALPDIAGAYQAYWNEMHHILTVELTCAAAPAVEEVEQVVKRLDMRYPDHHIVPEVRIDQQLMGGMCIRVGQEEYDQSYAGRLRQLEEKLTRR